MEENRLIMNRDVIQQGNRNLYVEHVEGDVNMYPKTKPFVDAVRYDSFLLAEAGPKIEPVVARPEVKDICKWIGEDRKSDPKAPRIALVTGSPGIGKTVVMNTIYEGCVGNQDYLTWGIKADQIAESEVFYSDNLQIYRSSGKTIADEIKEIEKNYKRIVVIVDQLDALSLSLSSDRKTLESIVTLIKRLSAFPSVRVVVSCRLYDLKYDPKLEDIRRISKEWVIGPFSHKTISNILVKNNYPKELSAKALDVLSNPLMLYIFLNVKDSLIDGEDITMEMLYDRFWDMHMKRDPDNVRLTEAIDHLTDKMAADQRINVNDVYLSSYVHEINRLCSSGLLTRNERTGAVGFFHQTLFDYVAARRFLERGRNLNEDILSGHQGLFIRPVLKSILDFQRSHDPKAYMGAVRKVLTEDSSRCRYHLRHMVVTSLGFRQDPTIAEKALVKKDLWNKSELMVPFLKSIASVEWLSFVDGLITEHGGFKALDPCYREAVIIACANLVDEYGDPVIDTLLKFFEEGDEKERNMILSTLEYTQCKSGVEPLKRIVTFFQEKYPQYFFPNLLKEILKEDPAFVEESLIRHIEYKLNDRSKEHWDRLRLNHVTESVFEDMERLYPDRSIQFLYKVITFVTRSAEMEIPGYSIRFSSAIMLTEHKGDGIYGYDYIEHLPRHIADLAKSQIDKGDTTAKAIAMKLSGGNNDIEVYTGLLILCRCLPALKEEAIDVLLKGLVIGLNPSWVLYGAGRLIEALIPYLNDKEKQKLIGKVMSVTDGETTFALKRIELNKRLEGKGLSLSFNGLERGKLLAVFGENELRRLDPEAYREYGRLSRKLRNLDNRAPSVIFSSVGFGALPTTKTSKMGDKEWLSSMKTYTHNYPIHFESPTLEGQAQQLELLVTENPDAYLSLAKEVVEDGEISMRYCTAMLKGFVKSGKWRYAQNHLASMLEAVNNDLNSSLRGFSLHNVLFSLQDIFQRPDMPDYFFQFLCRTVVEADDSDDFKKDEEASGFASSLMTHVINTTRGNAVYTLVKLLGSGVDDDKIFTILENIAPVASVATRGAALIYLGLGIRINRERTLRLFLSFNYDFNRQLMSLPLHNCNPLLYLVRSHFEDLQEYFNHAVESDVFLPSVVEILWYAFSFCGQQAVRQMLDKLLLKHGSAKVTLIRFINQNDDYGNLSMEYLELMMKEEHPTEELASALDSIFLHLKRDNRKLPRLLECYSDSASCKLQNRDFFKALGAFIPEDPEKSLRILTRAVDANEIKDQWIWNTVTDILLQAYNGIRDFEDELMADTLEKAMDLLDDIMRKAVSSRKISSFMELLDN